MKNEVKKKVEKKRSDKKIDTTSTRQSLCLPGTGEFHAEEEEEGVDGVVVVSDVRGRSTSIELLLLVKSLLCGFLKKIKNKV